LFAEGEGVLGVIGMEPRQMHVFHYAFLVMINHFAVIIYRFESEYPLLLLMFRMGKYDKVFLLSNDLQFLPIWVIVAMSYILAEKETSMSEIEQEDQPSQGIPLPITLHVPDTIHNQYVHNVIVQPGQNEITLFFFETHIPPYVGSPEANREYLLKQSVRFECVSKLVVAPQLVPEIIKALQVGWDDYNAGKAREERETRR
jgi:hypothetical protein